MTQVQQERVDTVQVYYDRANIIGTISTILLWISIVLSVTVLYVDSSPNLKGITNEFFILVTILYFMSTNSVSLYLLPAAERKRRTQLISNSFGVPLDDETTNLYYNNQQSPSLMRLGVNVFENSLFSKKIASKMLVSERIKVVAYFVIWICFMLNRTTQVDLLSTIAQTLLSTTLITDYLRLELLRHNFQHIYTGLRTLFMNSNERLDTNNQALLMDFVIRYEAEKSGMGVILSSKVFHKINPQTTQEWEEIKSRIGIS